MCECHHWNALSCYRSRSVAPERAAWVWTVPYLATARCVVYVSDVESRTWLSARDLLQDYVCLRGQQWRVFLFPSRDADLSSAVVVLSASVFSLASLSSSSSSSYYQFFSRSVQHRFFARVFLSTALLTVNEIVDENYIASKKQNTKLLPTTSPNINRFSFFHWQTR